ncbi:MAG: CHAD domain-containing protein, partial [Planctomycetota bacterium]|nr:CHAD domain-containing protein [Planctomycetota bacterium]
MRGFESGTRVGLDLEHLHKMRVAVRRLRNALTIFGDCFDQRRINALKTQYRWLAEVLGVVRDLDVQQANQEGWQQLLGQEPKAGWAVLRATLNSHWKKARQQLIDALNSARYKTLCERSVALFTSSPRRSAKHPGQQILATLGAAVIQKRTKQFRRRIKVVQAQGTAEVLHELRIEGKKLRYTTEFFKPIFKGKVKKDIAKLSEFQEKLGDFNDNCVTADFAAQLRDQALEDCPENGPYLYVLGQLYGWMTLSSNTAQRECEDALKELGGRKLTEKLEAQAQIMLQNAMKKRKSKRKRS